jgi:hypothetical protein
MSKRPLLVVALKRMGAFYMTHNKRLERKLGEHLLSTYDALKKLGADEEVALAGGLHSIYGTSVFRKVTVPPERRSVIRGLFGERAERLAWLFSVINRPKCLEGLEPVLDWRTGEPIEVSEQDLADLRLIEVANLGDNGSTLERYPNLREIRDKHMAPA